MLSSLEQAQAQTHVARVNLLPTIAAANNGMRICTSSERPLSSYTNPTMFTVQSDFVLRANVSYEANLFGHVRSTAVSAAANEAQVGTNAENSRLLLVA